MKKSSPEELKDTEQADYITSDDILGKVAIDSEGEMLGVIMKLHIERVSKSITGITVDQGTLKPDLFIGMDYIKRFGVDAVFLTRAPPDKYNSMKVITRSGKWIGTVAEVFPAQNGDIFRVLLRGKYSGLEGRVKRKTIDISSEQIEEIGGSVILKESYVIENTEAEEV